MRYFLLRTARQYYYLLRLTTPHPENALIEVIQVTDLEWAERHPLLTCVEVKPTADELQAVLAHVLYLRVDAWTKYYFPTFMRSGPDQDYTYQWYDIEEAEEMLFLVKQCLELADKVAGVRVGSR